MAFFTKKTWVARQGTGLNKFSINGATPVTVVNQPDSVTEQGDALSATNLNNLEQRIYDAFDVVADDIQDVIDDIEDGTIVAKKAEQDANGNDIGETYETKADATSYKATANAEIQNNSQRITNLETALTGTVIQTNTDSTQKNVKAITSASEILPWAILKRVGARSTQFNQLVSNGNFATTSDWFTYNASLTVNNNVATITATNNGGAIFKYVPIISGHTYLLLGGVKSNDGASVQIRLEGVYHWTPTSYTDANWHDISHIFSSPSTGNLQITAGLYTGSSGSLSARNIMLFDLTAMQEISLTADQFKAKFPASYYPYNAGLLIDLPPTSFAVEGVNLWKETWNLKGLNSATGEEGTGTIYFTSADYIPIKNTSVYFYLRDAILGGTMKFCFYDENKNYLGYEAGNVTDYRNAVIPNVPVNAKFIKFNFDQAYGTTYNNPIQIAYDSNPLKTTYHAYNPNAFATIDTSFMQGKKYINSDVYDYAENVYVDGVLKRKEQPVVGSIANLGSYTWMRRDDGLFYTSTPVIPEAKQSTMNLCCPKYLPPTNNHTGTSTEEGHISIASGGYIYVKDSAFTPATAESFKTAMANVPLYFELADPPVPTYADPIPNFPCEDGTTITAVTPQTDVVNAIDVPSTIVYGTKISA